MASMEFLGQNKINTTTMVTVDSGTNSAQYIFNRNPLLGYVSSGYTAATTTTLVFSLSAAAPISHILIQNHNLKDFTLYRDGTTTVIQAFTGNSATSTYISLSSVTVSAVHLVITGVMTAGQERQIGEFVIAERQLVLERNPTINDFNPALMRKQIAHEMPDGGISLYNIRTKYQARLKWEYLTQSFHDSLLALYDAGDPLYFVPRPTTTGWDGHAYEVNWIGNFDFKPSSNVDSAGYGGTVNLKQTPSGG